MAAEGAAALTDHLGGRLGVEKIFSEQVSSVAHREQLKAEIEFAPEGDTFVVTFACRLARSIRDLLKFTSPGDLPITS